MDNVQLLAQRYGHNEARALYEFVMKHRFGLSRTDILLGKDTLLSADDKAELQIIINRIANGEPVQYVLGIEEFCGRTFIVAPSVLIPRPETQLLVQLVQQHVASGSCVLDVGTGSGCIAITLALAGYHVTATDVSEKALVIARLNADRLGAKVEFRKEDCLSPEPSFKGKGRTKESLAQREGGWRGTAIISNPPYICKSEAKEMSENILKHEPHLALFVPDDDPLLFFRAIAQYGLNHLTDKGWLFFEVNKAYARQVAELLEKKGYGETSIVKDQYDNERFVFGRLRD